MEVRVLGAIELIDSGQRLEIGGQKQRTALARGLIRDEPVLILDDCFSSVDTETEELIQMAIQKLMKGRTSIVIAHRLSTIQDADQILVLDQGRIVERGDHETLLEKNGFYSHLHQMQYKDLASA